MSYNNHTYRKNLILNLINHLEPISRTELIELTDYRPATITDILNELFEENLITKKSDNSAGPGRKRSMLAINKAELCAIAITCSDDSATLILSQFDGEILKKEMRRVRFDAYDNYVLHQIANIIQDCIDEFPRKRILGIGIVGTSHFISCNPDTLWPDFDEWLESTLKPHLETTLHYPVTIYNNVALPILAQQHFGKAQDVQDFLCVNLGETISSYVCCNGIPVIGANHMAGKLGHTVIDYDTTVQTPCPCGKARCLEVTSSYSSLLNNLKKELKQGTASSLRAHHQQSKNEITNCWFDGTIHMPNKHSFVSGGILATSVLQSNVHIEHCLNTGTFICHPSIPLAQIGGLGGRVAHNSHIHLKDCVSMAVVTASPKTEQISPLIGYAFPSTNVTIDSTYYAEGMREPEYSANVSGKATAFKHAQTINLDFESYWSMNEDNIPSLKAFEDLSYDSAENIEKIVPDTDWYNPRSKEFTLYTAAELLGFSKLSEKFDFYGKTIYLGADITFNTGNAADWKDSEPENKWMPIRYFAGTFDGQGHTISGIYIAATHEIIGLFSEAGKDSIIQNFKLVNTYIYTSTDLVGSIAGRSNGAVRNIYTNAILYSEDGYCGGIVGQTNAKEKSITALSIRQSLEEKDRMCMFYAKNYAIRIGTAIANAVNLLNPKVIVLQGIMLKLGDYFINKLTEAIQENTYPAFGTLDIRISDDQEDILALGAIAEICNHYLRKNDYPWIYQMHKDSID